MTRHLSPELLDMVAERFKVLSEPARLSILNTLKGEERTVTDLVEITGLGQANISKHLNILLRHAFVRRRRDGMFVWYELADPDVHRLCEMMCKRLDATVTVRARALARSRG